MLRISKLTDYATVVLATLAERPDQLLTAATIAERTGIAAPTVSKLLKQLHKAGLLASTRGLHGGYQLAHAPAQITLAAVVDALEGPVSLTDCATDGPCGLKHNCHVARTWQRLTVALRSALNEVTLADLTDPSGAGCHPQATAQPLTLPPLPQPISWPKAAASRSHPGAQPPSAPQRS